MSALSKRKILIYLAAIAIVIVGIISYYYIKSWQEIKNQENKNRFIFDRFSPISIVNKSSSTDIFNKIKVKSENTANKFTPINTNNN